MRRHPAAQCYSQLYQCLNYEHSQWPQQPVDTHAHSPRAGPDRVENTKLSLTVHKGEDILSQHKSQKVLDLTSSFKEVLQGKSCGENEQAVRVRHVEYMEERMAKNGKSKARIIKKKLTEKDARQICMSKNEVLVQFSLQKKYYRPHNKLSASHSYLYSCA